MQWAEIFGNEVRNLGLGVGGVVVRGRGSGFRVSGLEQRDVGLWSVHYR
jgi:hypothetical protein